MSLEIKVPPVGESITEVTLSAWKKKDGDQVEMDEVIAELESDKATFELTAEKAGTLKTAAAEGDVLAIGAIVATIEEGGAPAAKAESAPAAAPATAKTEEPGTAVSPEVPANGYAPAPDQSGSSSLEIKVPPVGESITEVTLSRWMKKDGDAVEMDEAIAELESDKATFELTAEKAGVLKTIAREGDTLAIGAVVCTIEGGGAAAPAAATPVTPAVADIVNESPQAAPSKGTTYASGTPSPAAAKILAEKGVAATAVSGTGVDGRITKGDALNAQAESQKPQAESQKPAAPQTPQSETGARSDRREKMSSLRKTVAKRLVAVKNETAMLTTFNEVDMAPIMEVRSKYKDKFKEKHGVGLGFMSFFTKAVTEALKEWPAVGARIEGEEVVYSNFADISIAVSAPKGLVVPVIRNAESMSLAEIEKAIVVLAGKARENKLTINEMTGGTFTITNGGVFGSMMSTPIINSPQSAILGMHNIIERPVAVNGQVVIRPMMYLALSYDHRIIDGRESVSFLVRVKQLLEDPTRLLLGV
ncbi:2-oxoglutarate dehydrogenase complex dihydrolipoyllysine-residue succinyltransferase [Mucilaginibacter phyllosphaerae]|uniref:Dihydrolipoyllysine-residue succinyltransferase component of 2-oxoglutarate dehydrogenase complex n=1 Tax=Mucilaginibacter phyllosphaerae TaxID=1812349 RepID=A0A4Y8AK62_9SPHI|nr:2-oxoglutarate dehydrogenase complex dihydrolipoyllysine-residue succinyltransferase [Mucilaginibacter phyllosphaerae]MBB3967546.1 2-oxoglutarate dehydrogenase E2 component (dihydrolipoamide succinyltransferase) [Mucilaginibacter phyllosphaerae]TEW69394.1 2-oxoglutarate dehydrogenase complex dihydrolipoyllysine-residue succinyltransferase [Mucilaginibacter phyllosphaerae]GGH21331.1 dihydrolipoyllysine-residue succinyltransferase component of 2-oxoglutarate dehydrogenase complex [Mucilaginibac